MQGNEAILEFWIEAFCAELGELSGGSIRSSRAPHENGRQQAYDTTLVAEGPVSGELHITVEAGALVELTQLSEGVPLDDKVSCDPERIEVWRGLLSGAAARLSSKLTAQFTDSTNSRCMLLLADTRLMTEGDALSGDPGSRIERWLLEAGQTKIAITGRARIEFPERTEQQQATAPAEPALAQAEQPDSPSSTDTRATGTSARAPSRASQPAAPAEEPEPSSAAAARARRPARDLDDGLASPAQMRRLDLLLDIELEATLRFGAIEMPLREVLELGPGDVLSLDRHVQEPVELVVGDRIVARGEVVLIGGNFGLHVTEVAEPRRRLETIRCLF